MFFVDVGVLHVFKDFFNLSFLFCKKWWSTTESRINSMADHDQPHDHPHDWPHDQQHDWPHLERLFKDLSVQQRLFSCPSFYLYFFYKVYNLFSVFFGSFIQSLPFFLETVFFIFSILHFFPQYLRFVPLFVKCQPGECFCAGKYICQ